jgi:hypothetical protein
MGYYFNPPQLLPAVGRKLSSPNNNYEELVAQLNPGEKLMGYYDRHIFQNAVYLYSKEEFVEFENQVNAGYLKRLGFYALDEENYKKFVD